MPSSKNPSIEASYTLILSASELGLGTLLHTMHLPFSGGLLSLNQCFILAKAVDQASDPFLPIKISNRAAILKTLSPGGKRFRPMLAISIQGVLFSLGCLILGTNFLGRCLGAVLLSFWGFFQSGLIYCFIYGAVLGDLLAFYEKSLQRTGLSLYGLLLGMVVAKALLAVAAVALAKGLPSNLFERYRESIDQFASVATPQKKAASLRKGLLKDLTSPFFLFSLGVSGVFLYASVSSIGEAILPLCQIFGSAVLAFSLFRAPALQTFWKKIIGSKELLNSQSR